MVACCRFQLLRVYIFEEVPVHGRGMIGTHGTEFLLRRGRSFSPQQLGSHPDERERERERERESFGTEYIAQYGDQGQVQGFIADPSRLASPSWFEKLR